MYLLPLLLPTKEELPSFTCKTHRENALLLAVGRQRARQQQVVLLLSTIRRLLSLIAN
jgi:hypothetical protein